jgi:protein-L-isoaspartate(D-aspartate) O-methyltransferase
MSDERERAGGGADESAAARRAQMVERQLVERGIRDPDALAAMRAVPRHLFVPKTHLHESYEDYPLPIGFGQTISQPYIVALMLALAEPALNKRLLEVGSGCGYLLAVASNIFKEVVGVERIEGLYQDSITFLQNVGVKNALVLCGDGYEGVAQAGPYDAIIVSCACSQIPQPLLEQLAPGGVLVLPVGDALFQELLTVRRTEEGTCATVSHGSVRFVPLISLHDDTSSELG